MKNIFADLKYSFSSKAQFQLFVLCLYSPSHRTLFTFVNIDDKYFLLEKVKFLGLFCF